MKSQLEGRGVVRWVARAIQACVVALFVWRHDDRIGVPDEMAAPTGRLQTKLVETGISILGRLAGSDPYYELARGFGGRFVRSHPMYTLCPTSRITQGNTNRILPAKRDGVAVVIKFYGDEARKNCELFALDHLATSGVVPRVIDRGTNNLLVMERIPGTPLNELLRSEINDADSLVEMGKQGNTSSGERPSRGARTATEADTDPVDLGRQIGGALARISRIPAPELDPAGEGEFKPGSSSFQRADLKYLLRRYLDASWRVYREEPSYHKDFFRKSLVLQEEQLATVLSQRQFMYLYDMNPGNILIHAGQLAGFVDLEACRCGTEAMQLGAALFNFAKFPHLWRAILAGYERELGHRINRASLDATLAMSHYTFWEFVTYWGDGSSVRPKRFSLPDAADAARHFRACDDVIAGVLRDDNAYEHTCDDSWESAR